MRAGGTPVSPRTCSARRAAGKARIRRFALALAIVPALASAANAGDRELAPFEIVDGGIPAPLTDLPGDPVIGKQVVTNAANATCLICHPMPIPEQPDHGNLAPPLTGVGSRYTAAELRLRIVDPKVLNPDTIMPSYYRLSGFTRVSEEHLGETVYSAQDVEDAIAYLMTLTDK